LTFAIKSFNFHDKSLTHALQLFLMPILLVDDNEAHRYALGRVLDHAGFVTISAGTAQAATLLAVSQHPSLILLDIHLPDGTGFDIFNSLRSDPRTSDIPVVFHSATMYAPDARMQTEVTRAEGFLTYPIEPTQLFAVVEGVTARRPPRRRA
jgi:CheY-like chemotaxis protein